MAQEYSDDNGKLKIVGGSMGSEILDTEGVKAVSNMPSRDELISSIIAAIMSPASNIASTLSAPGSGVASAIANIEDQKAA